MSSQFDRDTLEKNHSSLKPQESTSNSSANLEVTKDNKVFQPKVDAKISFVERWETNQFWIVRATYQILKSIWMIVMVIGGFIAWLISLLFL